MLKNPYFTLKALFVPKIFKFLPWPFGHIEKWLIRKIRLISKFMTSQPGKQTIAIHILSNISRSKSNRTMKFGQLIECNMRNIFLKNSFTKCVEQTIPKPFSKKSILSISLDQQSIQLIQLFYYILFYWVIEIY